MDGWMDDDDDDWVSTNKGLFTENRRFRLPTRTGLVPLLKLPSFGKKNKV
jgi:hypothetical protein